MSLHRGFVNLPLQTVDATARGFKLRVIVCSDGARATLFQFLDARFDRSLVDAHNVVMRVHLDVQGFAYGNDQMFFV
jgi:hypothetical protein